MSDLRGAVARRRRAHRIAWIAALALAAACAAVEAADRAKTLRVAFPVDVTGFDPQANSDRYSGNIMRAIFDPPLAYDYLARPYRLIPNTLASLPEVKDGGRTIVFRLRKGIHFAPDPVFKGQRRELTAADYVYSWKRLLDPRVRSPYLWLLDGKLVGADALVAAARRPEGRFDYDAPLEGLRALDRYTWEIRLVRPDYGLLDYMTFYAFSAVAREAIAAYGDASTWANTNPVGTGPFALREWRRGSRLVLEANPHYREETFPDSVEAGDRELVAAYRGRKLPIVGRVEVAIIEESNPRFLSFTSREIDYFSLPPDYVDRAIEGERLKAEFVDAGVSWTRTIEPSLAYTYFNMEDPVVGGYATERIALRRAIVMGYNRPDDVKVVRRGQAVPATQPIPPGLAGHDPTLRRKNSYDPASARALLEKFGYRDRDGDGYRETPEGKPIVLRYGSAPEALNRQFDELWKKSMDAIGLRIEFVKQKWPDLLKMGKAGQLQMWGVGWISSVRDGDSFLGLLYSRNIGQSNYSRFSLPEFDRLYEQAKALPDGPERTALYRRMSELVIAYAPWDLGVYRFDNTLVHPWVVGFRKHAFIDHPWKFLDVDLAKREAAIRK